MLRTSDYSRAVAAALCVQLIAGTLITPAVVFAAETPQATGRLALFGYVSRSLSKVKNLVQRGVKNAVKKAGETVRREKTVGERTSLTGSALAAVTSTAQSAEQGVSQAPMTTSAPTLYPVDPVEWGLNAQAVELLDKRSRNSKEFRNPDGTHTAVFSDNLHYQASPGIWDRVDLNFEQSGGEYLVRKNDLVNARVTASGIEVWDKTTGKGIKWLTSAKAGVQGKKASSTEQGRVWEYEVRDKGVNIESLVTERRGIKRYILRYSLIGEAGNIFVDTNGDLVNDMLYIAKPIIVTAVGQKYTCSGWLLVTENQIGFDCDDSVLATTLLPYRLTITMSFGTRTEVQQKLLIPADPTEFGLAVSAQEIPNKRTRDAKYFKNADGTFAAIFSNNMHYEKTPGVWELVDLRLKKSGEEYLIKENWVNTKITPQGVEIWNQSTGKGIQWKTPERPIVRGDTGAVFTSQGLTWEYEIQNGGTKLSTVVSMRQGLKTYAFHYARLGVSQELAIDTQGDIVGEGFRVPRAFIRDAQQNTYTCTPWRLIAGNRAEFDCDDTIFPPNAFPYIIDPTTTFDGGSGDGYIYRNGFDGSTQSTAWTNATNGTTYNSAYNAQIDTHTGWVTNAGSCGSGEDEYSCGYAASLYRAFYTFPTASLDDGNTITSATLKLTPVGRSYTHDASIVVRSGGTQPIWGGSLDTGDWNVGSATETTWQNISAYTMNSQASVSVPTSSVNKTGNTDYVLIRASDTISNPGYNGATSYITFATQEHSTLSYRPQLTVIFSGSGTSDIPSRNADGTLYKALVGAGGTKYLHEATNTVNGAGFTRYESCGAESCWNAEYTYRAYYSFDTSSIGSGYSVTAATLKLTPYIKSVTGGYDASVIVRSGGTQPIWGSTLDANDWDVGSSAETTWQNISGFTGNAQASVSVPTASVNVTGNTEYAIKRASDETYPGGSYFDSYLYFYSSEYGTTNYRPILTVSFSNNSAPNAPSFSSPSVGSNNNDTVSFSASTTDADANTWYGSFELHNSAAYSGALATVTGSTVSSGSTSTTTWNISLTRGTYYVRAKAVDSAGASSGYTNLGAIYINRKPNTPTMSSPTASASYADTVTFTVTATDPDSDTYAGSVFLCADASCSNVRKSITLSNASSGAQSTYAWTVDIGNGVYYVRYWASDSPMGSPYTNSSTTDLGTITVRGKSPNMVL